MIALRLRRRRDGSLCLTDVLGRTSGPDRYFPEEHSLTFDFLATNSTVVEMVGDELKLNLANAKAVYKIVGRDAGGVHLKLERSELSDPPAIDEKAAAVLAATRSAVSDAGDSTEAASGAVVVEED